MANINRLFSGRNNAMKFIQSYGPKILESKRLAKQGTGPKILTPKQILQRLPIALAQEKADNNSESLLNEIRQFVYSLYQPKEIIKKVQNSKIEPVKYNTKWTLYLRSQKIVELLSFMF